MEVASAKDVTIKEKEKSKVEKFLEDAFEFVLEIWHLDYLTASRIREFFGLYHHDVQKDTLAHIEIYQTSTHEQHPYMLSPTSGWRMIHDTVVALLVLYLSFMIPIQLFFYWEGFKLSWLDWLIEMYFVCDIALNFRTGFIGHNGDIVMNPREVAQHYLRFWFIIDILASFPFEQMQSDVGKKHRKALKIWKLFKLPKLLRLGRIVRYLRSYFRYASGFKTISVSLFVLHVMACLYFHVFELPLHESLWKTDMVFQEYFRSIYMVFASMTLSSNIEVDTRFPDQMWYKSFLSLFSIIFCALVFSHTYMAVENTTSSRVAFRKKLSQIHEDMEELRFPDELKYKVMKYYDYLWLHQKLQGSQGRLPLYKDKSLSTSLRKDIANHVAKNYYPLARIFRGNNDKAHVENECPDDCLVDMVMAMTVHIFLPGTVIVKAGDSGHEVFFIARGVVEVKSAVKDAEDQDISIERIVKGHFFGEIALLVPNSRRTATCVAETCCELGVITAEDFSHILDDYPKYKEHVLATAKRRLKVSEQIEDRNNITNVDRRQSDHLIQIIEKERTQLVEDSTKKTDTIDSRKDRRSSKFGGGASPWDSSSSKALSRNILNLTSMVSEISDRLRTVEHVALSPRSISRSPSNVSKTSSPKDTKPTKIISPAMSRIQSKKSKNLASFMSSRNSADEEEA
eukprot:g2608.t1